MPETGLPQKIRAGSITDFAWQDMEADGVTPNPNAVIESVTVVISDTKDPDGNPVDPGAFGTVEVVDDTHEKFTAGNTVGITGTVTGTATVSFTDKPDADPIELPYSGTATIADANDPDANNVLVLTATEE